MEKKYPEIVLYKFIFSLELLEDTKLPDHTGSTFRGAFGWHLQNAVTGVRPIYEFIFETPAFDNNPYFLQGVQKVSHPYIFHTPVTSRNQFSKGDIIELGITLVGFSHNFLPFFIDTFKSMGKAGITVRKNKFKLLNVFNEDYFGNKKLIYKNEDTSIFNNYNPITFSEIVKNTDYSTSSITINLNTPLLIQSFGNEIKKFNHHLLTPSLFVSSLERRYKTLSQLFCRSSFEEKEIFRPDDSVTINYINLNDCRIERFSNRIQQKQVFEGLVGTLKLQGNLSSILPLIYLGEKIHIGKKTSFGWGNYQITVNL